ncbi:hypothetical protein LRR81_03865 [Metabacillus sp. GX 13764]|uniref:hypothetical protein n=1 Tax=Metabacillus kandeliae TaxID=2900151 RepID=UPI001E30849F|nr:hypothetical protein [Metabacillus kandeliae]MCD7033355.1 hypothetical protein [Metabacillus kandeliae]
MKKLLPILLLMFCIPWLGGCMYPEGRLAANQVPYESQMESVQKAIEQFQKDNGGILPIKTRNMKTPIYQKYPIDFNRLIPKYLPDAPGNAYESGGNYLYVLLHAEKKPEVKLIDLRTSETIRDLKIRLAAYMESNGYPPYSKVLSDKVYSLDFKELGYQSPPQAVSPYSGVYMPIVIDNKGNLYADYSVDLAKALKESGTHPKNGEDIRDLLAEKSPFVPAFSMPYTVNKDNEPIFMIQ